MVEMPPKSYYIRLGPRCTKTGETTDVQLNKLVFHWKIKLILSVHWYELLLKMISLIKAYGKLKDLNLATLVLRELNILNVLD